jgi:mRNA-degrading endonuclease YafQ of YafQ-DinJ toxin-antitoxin module
VSYALVATRHFERRLARFRRAHPELRQRLAQVLRDLETDPFQPHLRLHPLKGRLTGLHAVRLTYAYRLTITLKLTEGEIILLDIGSHDEVYE